MDQITGAPAMRFSIRTDGQLVLGKILAGSDMLKPGHVYEVREMLDTLIIRDLGPSAASKPGTSGGTASMWQARDANDMAKSGMHLYTPEEWAMVCKNRKD